MQISDKLKKYDIIRVKDRNYNALKANNKYLITAASDEGFEVKLPIFTAVFFYDEFDWQKHFEKVRLWYEGLWDQIAYCASEIDRLEIKKTIMLNKDKPECK